MRLRGRNQLANILPDEVSFGSALGSEDAKPMRSRATKDAAHAGANLKLDILAATASHNIAGRNAAARHIRLDK